MLPVFVTVFDDYSIHETATWDFWSDDGIRTHDLVVEGTTLLPTELSRHSKSLVTIKWCLAPSPSAFRDSDFLGERPTFGLLLA